MRQYIEYELVTKDLARHRYKYGDKRPFETETSKEKPTEKAPKQEEKTLEIQIKEAFETSTEPPKEEKPAKAARKKPQLNIFEDTPLEELNKEIESQINKDGYYDELLPSDYGIEFTKAKKKKAPVLVFVAAGILFIAAIIVLTVSIGRL